MPKYKKTVYILGAGFSMPAGAPSQGALVNEILGLKEAYPRAYRPDIVKWVDCFEAFLREELFIDPEYFGATPLEDIFTPIDRCIIDGISFRNFSPKTLVDLRETFYKLIILAIRKNLKKADNTGYVNHFANYLVNETRPRATHPNHDRVAVISTNWDVLLDNSIQNELDEEPVPEQADFAGVVDYCCYISSRDENDRKIKPGLYALGKGAFNVKLLKLHGSMNWLHCPKCQRLYVKFYKNDPAGFVFKPHHCRHCISNFKNENKSDIRLYSNLIMPTFLKDLSNFQNKLIWQNAGIELSEADKVIFIGYSLPHADFELRQLLSRMIRKDAEIEVVLRENDFPDQYGERFKHFSAGYRYETFFSGRKLNMVYSGASEYLLKL